MLTDARKNIPLLTGDRTLSLVFHKSADNIQYPPPSEMERRSFPANRAVRKQNERRQKWRDQNREMARF